jgi:glycyl-tRNA synthetase beta chain
MTAELLFEVGSEELPERAVTDALAFFALRGGELATVLGTEAKPVTLGTPRRLLLSLSGIPAQTPKYKEEKLGPPARAAWNDKGEPTKAAEGFAKGLGLAVSALERKQTPKGEYAAATVETGGEESAPVITRFLSALLTQIPFSKAMRWGDEDVRFARPVQWLVAVLDGKVLPVSFGTIHAQNQSRGHRFMANQPFAVTSLKAHQAALLERFVIADPVARREKVLEEARKAAKEAGGTLFCDGSAESPLMVARYFTTLLDEVTELCEFPFGVSGSFDASALALPREVILTSMRAHQRYFAVVDASGKLLPKFVTVAASRVKDVANVRRGNERALKPRLNDASYFFNEDQKRPILSRVADLQSVTYHKKLGSSYEKVERALDFAFAIAAQVGKGAAPTATLTDYLQGPTDTFYAQLGRAVALSKADLTTLMVGEFPELQGFVGAEYARAASEPAEIVAAVAEHYMPRSAEDGVPESELGALVALADKLDTINAIIGIGQAPTGSSDPFALRRAALGVIRILIDCGARRGWSLDLSKLGLNDKTVAFIAERFTHHILPPNPGADANAVRAVVAAGFSSPAQALQRVRAVQTFAQQPEFAALAATLKRVLNILKDKTTGGRLEVSGAVVPALFAHASEGALYNETQKALELKRAQPTNGSGYINVLVRVAAVQPVVDQFFDAVMVMDKNESIKINRMRLLRDVAALTADIADFEKL